jgi:rfaE bifunctional protein kinase chain/domain
MDASLLLCRKAVSSNYKGIGVHVTKLQQLGEALHRIGNLRVTVFGDFCLDAYWLLDEHSEEVSVETNLPVRRVRTQQYSLGGAANVAANLVDLGIATVRAVGLAGTDVFGPTLIRLLEEKGVDTSGFETDSKWQTTVYTKPCMRDAELSRIDFGSFNLLTQDLEDRLIANLALAASASDAVVLNQQIPQGINGPAIVARVNSVIAAHPRVHFVVDARDQPDAYDAAVLKLNLAEACRYLKTPFHHGISLEEVMDYAGQIHARTRRPAFITCGPDGIVFADEGKVGLVRGNFIQEPLDTVASVLAAALGAGYNARMAAEIANIAATITVKKLRTTGTASPQEILATAESLDYDLRL